MKKIKLSRNFAIIMAIMTLVCSLGTTTAFAAEPEGDVSTVTETSAIEPRAGTETLPLGWYTISSKFSIRGHNTTPVKTVQGQYLRLSYNATKGATSEPLAILTRIKDYNTGEFIGGTDVFLISDKATTAGFTTIQFDLGYAGRKVQIYTYIQDARSATENTSLVTFTDYQSYVYN